jgi:alpha-D-ribose 1-methylphosphonate 5-phosphate C-P lyase
VVSPCRGLFISAPDAASRYTVGPRKARSHTWCPRTMADTFDLLDDEFRVLEREVRQRVCDHKDSLLDDTVMGDTCRSYLCTQCGIRIYETKPNLLAHG